MTLNINELHIQTLTEHKTAIFTLLNIYLNLLEDE